MKWFLGNKMHQRKCLKTYIEYEYLWSMNITSQTKLTAVKIISMAKRKTAVTPVR